MLDLIEKPITSLFGGMMIIRSDLWYGGLCETSKRGRVVP